jgi:hypothetical protein
MPKTYDDAVDRRDPADGVLRSRAPWKRFEELAYLILFVSAALQFAAFATWPGSPDADVVHSAFAGYNFVTRGHLQSINLFAQNTNDLARHAQIYWMTHWPPAHSWLYALVMSLGLNAGAATKFLGLCSVLVGGIGWVRLTAVLGASRIGTAIVAASYPWIFFIARTYMDYKNDHLACALVPWVYVGIIQIVPIAGWVRLITLALLAGSTILVKYSLAPVLAATGLYFLWLEARPLSFTAAKMLRVATFAVGLLLPGSLLLLANGALGLGSYPLKEGEGVSLGPVTFLNNIISNTFGAVTGWSHLLTELNTALELYLGVSLFRGTIVAVSLVFIVIWVVASLQTKWSPRQIHFLQYMCLLTAILWAFLYLLSVSSGRSDNLALQSRYYFPIGFGWIVLGAVLLDKLPRNSLIMSPRFYSLAIPLLFSFFFFAATGVFGHRWATMPNSRIWWDFEDFDQRHAAFPATLMKERGKGPDLVITSKYYLMLELGVPMLWQYKDFGVFYSSKNLEVWAMIEPVDETVFLAKFQRASTITPVTGPPGFPFKCYILSFVAAQKE